VVAQQCADSATVIGYGPADRVDAVMPEVRAALATRGLEVLEALRVADGRFWSYLCVDPGCCPPDGTPFDPETSPVSAAATYAGQVALPDRAALGDRVAPADGPLREAMRAATERARARLADVLDGAPVADVLGGRVLRSAGEAAVTAVLDRARTGLPPTDDDVAWLTLLLAHVPVRDYAWRRITEEDWQLELWCDVVRRAEPAFAAGPASLLAFAAWLAGHGALANLAVDRALAEDPDYSMARLLRDALDRGLSPDVLGEWPASSGDGGRGGTAAPSTRPRRRGGRAGRRRTVRG
jgi:hypothetical protein